MFQITSILPVVVVFLGQPVLAEVPKLKCQTGQRLEAGPSGDRYMQMCVQAKNALLKDGPFEMRHLKTLKLMQSGNYRRNVLHGDVKVYSEEGNLTAIATFEDGIVKKQAFFTAFNPTHKIKEVLLGDKGRKIAKESFWNLKGKPISEAEFKKLEPMWSHMEQGKTEVLKLYELMHKFKQRHGIFTTDLVAIDYLPTGTHRYLCGFAKPSKARVGPRGQRLDPSRLHTWNVAFRKSAGPKYKFAGQARPADLPPTVVTTTGFTVACVARFFNDKDVWTIDHQKKMTHISTLGD